MNGRYTKPAAAVLDYGRDWSDWLPTGDTIATSTWAVDAGLTLGAHDHDDTSTRVWLSGGTVGEAYWATNRITTAGGRTDERAIQVRIVDRRMH